VQPRVGQRESLRVGREVSERCVPNPTTTTTTLPPESLRTNSAAEALRLGLFEITLWAACSIWKRE
jgi:hypothetical protein